MGQVIYQHFTQTNNTDISTTGTRTYAMERITEGFPQSPYRVTRATLAFSYINCYTLKRYLEVRCNDGAVNRVIGKSAALGSYLPETGYHRDVLAFDLYTDVDYSPLTQVNIRAYNGSGISGDGSAISVRSSSYITLTVEYELTTTACTPLTSLTLDRTLMEGDAVLTGSGAGGGVNNGITGYELQFKDSQDGVNYGGWQGHATVAAGGGSFSAAVPPPNQGVYRKWRARAVGSAGVAWASPFTETGNAVRRYAPSTLTLSRQSLDAGETNTARIGAMAGNLTHRVTWAFGEKRQQNPVAAGVNSDGFTIPPEWLDQIPNALSGQAGCILETLLDGAVLGSVTCAFTVTCPAGVVPRIEGLRVEPVSDRVPLGWGLYLKGQSRVRLTMEGVAAGQGSKIASYAITGGGYSGSQSTLLTGLLSQAGNVTFTATVTDGRGRKATKAATVFVTDYQEPRITRLEAYRTDANGVEKNDGDRIGGWVQYDVARVGQNQGTISVFVNGAETVASAALNLSSNRYDIQLPGPFDTAKSFRIGAAVRDTVNAITATAETWVNTASRILSVGAGVNAGIGMGKISEREKTLEIAEDWEIRYQDGSIPFKSKRVSQLDCNQAYHAGVFMGTDANTFTNAPSYSDGQGTLIVIPYIEGPVQGWIRQEFISAHDGTAFSRYKSGQTWKAWVKTNNANHITPVEAGGTGADSNIAAWANLYVFGGKHLNGYWGLVPPDNNDSTWVRAPLHGLLPYSPGGASALGTPDWPFLEIHAKTHYGTWNGNLIAIGKGGTGATNSTSGYYNLAYRSAPSSIDDAQQCGFYLTGPDVSGTYPGTYGNKYGILKVWSTNNTNNSGYRIQQWHSIVNPATFWIRHRWDAGAWTSWYKYSGVID